MEAELRKHFEFKVSGRLGSDKDDDKAVRILNRTAQWTSEGIVLESDTRHTEIVVKQLGFDGDKPARASRLKSSVKSVSTPGIKETPPEKEVLLSKSQASMYRSIVMRINYLA